MFCQKCGAPVSPQVRFCPKCGQPLAPAAPAAQQPVPHPQTTWTPPVGVRSDTGRWVSEGWQMVKADLGTYIVLALIFTAINSVGSIITQGPLMVGFHIVCMKKMLNRQTEIGDIFKGFHYFVPAMVASIIIGLFTFVGALACLVGSLVVVAIFNFTYLFIVDKRMDFWPAMQASHAVVKNDYFGFTMFALVLMLVNLLGVLCCIVGVFVAMPVTVAAITVAYKHLVGFEPGSPADAI